MFYKFELCLLKGLKLAVILFHIWFTGVSWKNFVKFGLLNENIKAIDKLLGLHLDVETLKFQFWTVLVFVREFIYYVGSVWGWGTVNACVIIPCKGKTQGKKGHKAFPVKLFVSFLLSHRN